MIPNKIYHKPLLLGICLIMFFSHLADVSPPTIMEARNFISAREMLESGNWLVPTLNGNIRIRKPPLPTWLTATSIAVAGHPNSLMALRFPAAIIATVMIFFLYGLVEDLLKNSNVAFYAAAVLASCYMFVEEAKTGAWDIYCNAFMLGAIWMLYRASLYNQLKYWALSGLFMGFSFLSKGPVSFYALLLPFLIAFFLSKNKFKRSSIGGIGLCILIMLVVSAAWPVYLYLKVPDIATQIAEEESSAWINRHNRPLWYYLHFPLFTGIWTVATLFAFYNFKKLKRAFPANNLKLALFWFLVTLLLLSVIPEKKERYFLPALPPLAILIGAMINHHIGLYRKGIANKAARAFTLTQGILMILAVAGIAMISWQFGVQKGELTAGSFVLVIVPAIGIMALIAISLYKKKEFVYPLAIVTMLFFCISTWPLIPKIKQDNPLYQDLREIRSIKSIESMPFYSTVQLSPVRIWEIGRQVNMINDTKTAEDEAIRGTQSPLRETLLRRSTLRETLPGRNDTKAAADGSVIISDKQLADSKEAFKFHPNPDNEREVLYFNVME